MDFILNVLLAVVCFASFIPVTNMFNSRDNKKYRCLKYLIFTTFAWTVIIILERFLTPGGIVYYLHMLSYPTKFFLAVAMLCTIFDYISKTVPKWLLVVLGVLFVFELILAVTNNHFNFLVQLNINELQDFTNLYNAAKGPLFIVHLVITYITLVSAIVFLFIFLNKHRDVLHYKSVTKTMTISSFLVLAFNVVQLTIIKSSVDLTYVSLVIVVYILYKVIYANDMMFNLKTSGRGEILSNMREMYILTDSNKRVVEFSPLLLKKYAITEEEYIGKRLDLALNHLRNNVVLHSSYNVEDNTLSEKDHLHLREKRFTLKGMNTFGYMVLLYDETQVFSLLRELNQLSNFDQMTNLHNRNYIENLIEKLDSYNMGVISLDLNGLKTNNDYLGHERGDYLLKRLAMIMKESCMNIKEKEMARIGGDEFIILVDNTTREVVESVKNKILELSKNKDLLERVSVSIGTSYNDHNDKNIYELIRLADQSMYDMKKDFSKEYSAEIMRYAQKESKFIR